MSSIKIDGLKPMIYEVVYDLMKHISKEQPTDDIGKPSRYYYDRMDWIRENRSDREDEYEIGLESIRVLIYQLGLFQRNILMDDNGKEIQQTITE
jgi:hypothetical protein